MPAMPQNEKAKKIALKIMGQPQNRMTAEDIKKAILAIKKETSSLVRA